MTAPTPPATTITIEQQKQNVILSPPPPLSTRAKLLQRRCTQWSDLFQDRIYLVCNQTHPGMGLENDAMQHINEILQRILFEILEQRPENEDDLLDKVKTTFPLALTNFLSPLSSMITDKKVSELELKLNKDKT